MLVVTAVVTGSSSQLNVFSDMLVLDPEPSSSLSVCMYVYVVNIFVLY